jgi:3-dehydroquinate synthase
MLTAAEIGVSRGLMPPADRDALTALITKMGPLPPVADLDASQVVEAMGRDKKVVAGTLHFVLPGPIGSTHIATDVTSTELQHALVRIGLRPERNGAH